jgi:Arc/MetJ-type ribon-helix-helix transcriptional regulator
MINIALTDDLQTLLRMKVDNGEFPNEEAVVEAALKCFLTQELRQGRRHPNSATEFPEERLPGPFIEDQASLAPVELPRPGREIARSYLHDAARQPNLFPGE